MPILGEKKPRKSKEFISYGVHSVKNGFYKYLPEGSLFSIKKPIKGAKAEFTTGLERSCSTTGPQDKVRVIAGCCGEAMTSMLKSSGDKNYVTVLFADGETASVSGPLKHERRMREFAASINRLGIEN